MTLREGGVLFEELQGVCWAAEDDIVGKFCYGVLAGDDDQLLVTHIAAYWDKDGVAPYTMFMPENVGATYVPDMECATYDPDVDCYLLRGGNEFSAEWF